jgi:tetratricopeptide (TPR) repeat protein
MPSRYPQPDNERTFEKFCLKFLQRHWNNAHLELYGKRGEAQSGIDIIDMSFSDGPFRAGQCKHHEANKTIPPSEIEAEVQAALEFDPPIDHFAILTTARASTQAQNAIIRINREHKQKHIKMFVELFYWEKIEDLLDEYPDVKDHLVQVTNSSLRAIEESQVQLGEMIDRLRGDVISKVDAVVAVTSSNQFDSLIDEAEAYNKSHDPQVARIHLEKLRKHRWEELSDSQKYRVMSALANAAFQLGNDAEAGRTLLEAKAHQPHAERARINEAIGYEFLGKREKAHEVAEGLLDTYPNSGHLVSCWIRTASSGVSFEDLRSRVNAATEGDAQVNVALSLRAIESKRYEDAQGYARKAIQADAEWVGPKSLLGQALANLALGHSRTYASAELKVRANPYLDEAIAVLTETVTLAESQGTLPGVADCFVYRALAFSLRDDDERAEADYREAIRRLPGNATAHLRFASYLLDRKKNDEAISQLRKSLAISPGAEAEISLAEALRERGQPGDLDEAISIFTVLAKSDDASLRSSQPLPDVGLLTAIRAEAFNHLVECLLEGSRTDETEELLATLPSGRFSDVSMKTARAKLRLAKDDLEGATAAVDEAVRAITSETLDQDLRNLALLLMKLERHKDALPIWQRLREANNHVLDVRPLVKCAERVKQFGIVLRTCREARECGLEDRWLFDQELSVLEQFDVDAAIALLQERLASHPEDKHARLHLSRMGLYLRRKDLVDPSPGSFPSIDEVTPYGGCIIVEILRRFGDPNEAVRFAYELFRRHYEHHIANQTLVMAVMAHRTKQPVFADCSEVEAGMAVRYSEPESPDKWMVVEDSPNPNVALNEYPASHQLSQSLLGKKVGDSFVITKTLGRDRVGTVREIVPKYIYRTRDIWENWQVRFPDVFFVQVFKIAKDGETLDGKEIDLTDMKLIADERHERLKEAERTFQAQTLAQPISLHNLGEALGGTTFEALFFAALSPTIHVRSNHPGRPNDAVNGLDALKTGPTLVLDITALATAFLLRLGELLEKWPGKLVISQSTAALLRAKLDEVSGPTKRAGSFGKTDEGYFFLEDSPEEAEARAEQLRSFIELVLTRCEQRGCPEMVDLDPELRDKLCDNLGQDAVESMLLARAPGHVLWTEEFLNAEIAAVEYGARRVWTQLVLQHADEVGLISTDTFLTTCAKLIGYRFDATSVSAAIIIKAGEMAEWDVRRWPFAEALEVFRGEHIFSVNLATLAAFTIKGMYGKVVIELSRQHVTMQILELLLGHPEGRRAIFQLARAIPSLFGVDVIAAMEVSQTIRTWLTEASRRPRMLGPLIERP